MAIAKTNANRSEESEKKRRLNGKLGGGGGGRLETEGVTDAKPSAYNMEEGGRRESGSYEVELSPLSLGLFVEESKRQREGGGG